MYIGLYIKYPLFLSDFNETWIFLDRCSKNSQTSNFIKIRPVGAELYHAEDGQTDRYDEANSRLFAILRKRLKITKNM
jgi:hypothetical protein